MKIFNTNPFLMYGILLWNYSNTCKFTRAPSLPPAGISTFSSQPEKAFDSLRPLLDYATLHIPPSKHPQTSLYIFCTAGMRLLPTEDQERITSILYRTISDTYPFYLPQDGIDVISGKLEGRSTKFKLIGFTTISHIPRLSPVSHWFYHH